jgi:hypothetical protein
MQSWSVFVVFVLFGCSSSQEEQSPQKLEAPKWPRAYQDSGDKVVVYEPQVEGEWKDHRSLHAISAIVVTPKGTTQDAYGVMEYDVDTEVNVDTREVLFKDRKIAGLRFPGMAQDAAKRASEIVTRVLSNERELILPLDFVLAYLEDQGRKVPSVKVNLDPPPIFTSQEPAILVIFMGEPAFKPVPNLNLEFATNTNWDVFRDPSTSRYTLLNGQGWIMTKDLEKGPWETASSIPSDLWKLPADKNWEDVLAQLPGKQLPAPNVFLSKEPAELIVIEGRPIYESIPGTQLSFVSNTSTQLFYDEEHARYYFLTSGRWFRSDRLEGPWSAATLDLPIEFGKIPKDHPKAEVLASVPGTQEALDAVLLAQVPRKATVDRKTLAVTVIYEGEPKFQDIEGTKVQYAVNTPNSVFLVNGRYYCCYQAVWFESASATGPWIVCASVPVEIYSIPSTHPQYPVTYVRVYDSTPDTVVVGTTAGYEGMYVAAGVVMFGMGMAIAWSDPWCHYHYGPAYYGYGGGAYYSYHAGGYYSGARYYGPYGGAGWGTSYNPYTGTYSRGAAAAGPYGSRSFAESYNPYTGRYSARSGGSTPYSQWGRGVTVQGDDWARGGYYRDARGTVVAGETSAGGKAAGARTSQGSAYAGRSASGDLYAGRDGNVYKKSGDQWQQRDSSGNWSSAQKPETSRQLDSSAESRSRGWENTSRSTQRSSGMSSRGGGGRGGRGGGGRR